MHKTQRINMAILCGIPILVISVGAIFLNGVSISENVLAVMTDNKTGMMTDNKTGMMTDNKTG